MRKTVATILTCILLMLFSSCATLTALPEQESSLQSITEFPGYTKAVLFNKCLSWAARSYNSSNDVIQLKDLETGQIVCKGMAKDTFDIGFTRYFTYTLLIDVKEGKIRIRFENINSRAVNGIGGPDIALSWDTISSNLTNVSKSLITSIKESKVEENW